MTENVSIREKIILAAIDCIEKEGIQSVTVRGIAREAGVNVAAINYYFGSKEKLLDEVLRTTLDHLFEDWEEILQREQIGPRERLELLFDYTMEGILRYPGITRAHLYAPLMEGDYNGRFMARFSGFMMELVNRLKTEVPGISESQLRVTMVQLMSSVMLPGLLPEMFREAAGLSFTDPATRRSYVAALVDRCLKTEVLRGVET